MADKTGIAWADATINPAYGCSPVSPACDNCYAARMAGRLGALTEGTHKDGQWTGKINLFPGRMEQALRWRKPRRIFVGSMTDLFHKAIPDEFLDRVFASMAVAPQHTFVLLTKRPERMLGYLRYTARQFFIAVEASRLYAHRVKQAPFVHESGPSMLWPLANIILMATIEDQPRADERMPHLMELAGMGWRTGVSVEPMLGPVDLEQVQVEGGTIHALSGRIGVDGRGMAQCGKLSWIICGGESGPDARPMHPDWARGVRDQCAAAGVPYFFKQWGEWGELSREQEEAITKDASPLSYMPNEPIRRRWHGKVVTFEYTKERFKRIYAFDNSFGLNMAYVGKHAAGRLLDGVEHNAFPEVRS